MKTHGLGILHPSTYSDDDKQYTAYLVFNKRHLLTQSMNNLKKLEAWLRLKLEKYTFAIGLIIDNDQGKLISKYKRSPGM